VVLTALCRWPGGCYGLRLCQEASSPGACCKNLPRHHVAAASARDLTDAPDYSLADSMHVSSRTHCSCRRMGLWGHALGQSLPMFFSPGPHLANLCSCSSVRANTATLLSLMVEVLGMTHVQGPCYWRGLGSAEAVYGENDSRVVI
jgi:hypothetical protein